MFAKFRKGRIRGVSQPASLKQNAVVGLQSCENAKLSSNVLWSVQRVLHYALGRKAKVHLTAFPHLGLTKKPSEVRIGKGRGSVSVFVNRVRCGDQIQQVSHESVLNSVSALKKAQYKLGIRTRVVTRVQPSKSIKSSFIFLNMPQLDLVTFPSQIFWLAFIFLSFYAFVSGHFVPILHKITQIRSKKLKNLSTLFYSTNKAVSHQLLVGPESIALSTLDTSVVGLSASTDEALLDHSAALRSNDCFKVCSVASTVGITQGRSFFSRF